MTLSHWLIRIALGVTFVAAGTLKILDPARFASAVANYRLLPLEFINIFAIFLPWIELVAGMCVLLGIWLRPAALVLTVTTVIFILAVASALARGLNIECGCFGKIGGGKVGLQNLSINIILFTLAAALTVRTRDPAERDTEDKPSFDAG